MEALMTKLPVPTSLEFAVPKMFAVPSPLSTNCRPLGTGEETESCGVGYPDAPMEMSHDDSATQTALELVRNAGAWSTIKEMLSVTGASTPSLRARPI